MPTVQQRLLIVLIAIDHLVLAVVTLGRCVRGETISAALWSLERDGKLQGRIGRPLVDALFRPLERDHCEASWVAESYLYRAKKDDLLAAK
jgi:hypothetical protein